MSAGCCGGRCLRAPCSSTATCFNWAAPSPRRKAGPALCRVVGPAPLQWGRPVTEAEGDHDPGVSPGQRRSLDWTSATLTDVAVDGTGSAKPFALHFTAGQQRFLTVALELLDGSDLERRPSSSKRPVDADDIRAAIFGPWPSDRELKVFSWSPTQDRAYALRAVDPSDDKKLGNPGADWLALRGIAMLSSAPVGTQIHTGGVLGSWNCTSSQSPRRRTTQNDAGWAHVERNTPALSGLWSICLHRSPPEDSPRLTWPPA